MKNNLVIIAGPTAVGKSDLSISLAKKVNGNIISADSMQVYKGMDIGTAKVTTDEMQGIPHFLIDVLDPNDNFDVFTFKGLANDALKTIYKADALPIICGGTGFYIQSVLYNIDFDEEDSDIRKDLEALALTEEGREELYNRLLEVDSESCKKIHKNNVKRVIRALEFFYINGKKISEHNKEQEEKTSPYNNAYFVLNDDREYIYNRCDMRVDKMIELGLVDEVNKLLSMGLKGSTGLQGIGYKEIVKYLDGQISLDEAIYIIKRDTRHFVKRQLTYFKREKDAIWIDKRDYDRDNDKIIDKMESILNERNII